MSSWIDDAILELKARQGSCGAWSYRLGDTPATEATALAVMALAAHDNDPTAGLAWLTTQQRGDGGFAPIGSLDLTNWTTAPAAIALMAGNQTSAADAAVQWLKSVSAYTFTPSSSSPYGYDTTLAAWPWFENDYSWVEPTSLAMIALRKAGLANDPKVQQGRTLMLDRQCQTGGWNYGEPQVLGSNLPPAAAPTGLAVLALHNLDVDLAGAIAFLQSQRDTQTSLFSMAWAGIALAATGLLDEAWRTAIAELWTMSVDRRNEDGGMLTALSLLAIAEADKNPLITA